MTGPGAAAASSIDDLLGALEESLEAEQRALIERDPDALASAAGNKQTTARRIADLFGRLDDRGKRAAVSSVLGTIERCQTLNEASGRTIAGLLNDTRAALELLGAGPRNARYDARGVGAAETGPRSLGRG